jgi:hypothetical protein
MTAWTKGRVLVIGTCCAILLAPICAVGATWHYETYPGLACRPWGGNTYPKPDSDWGSLYWESSWTTLVQDRSPGRQWHPV